MQQESKGRARPLWWNRPVIYWQANQAAITFHSPVDRSAGVERVIASLHLETLDHFLQMNGFQITSFTLNDILGQEKPPAQESEQLKRDNELPSRDQPPLDSAIGKYLFAPPSGQGTLAMCFFHSHNPSSSSGMSMSGSGKGETAPTDTTQAIVTLLNQNIDLLRKNGDIPIVAAMPNWIGGNTQTDDGPVGHGCPATPPIPVTGGNTCNNWHITLPQLSQTLQELDGTGVTVFVLDSIPTADQVRSAALLADNNNILLQGIVAAMDSAQPSFVIDHLQVPKRLAHIQTGKDVYGRLFGFKMPDHGLFVSGIIHDLAPKANIVCVRVLNNSGIGDFGTICQILNGIQEVMSQDNLKQVVVNLSLVISPGDDELPGLWFGDNCCCHADDLAGMMEEIELIRVGMHMVIKSLAAQGAVIVAAAGNDSDANNYRGGMGMQMGVGIPARNGPRYPAAFPEVISVGAVDGTGQAASYSNYPALPPEHNGIATYGGGLPTPVPPAQPLAAQPEPPGAKTWADVSDAVVGVYSSPDYPMLSATDEPPNDYAAPIASNGWAYWSGTSFSTPIISGLAARVLQGQQSGQLPTSMSAEDIVTTAQGQQALTANNAALPNLSDFGVGVGILQALQGCP